MNVTIRRIPDRLGRITYLYLGAVNQLTLRLRKGEGETRFEWLSVGELETGLIALS